MIVLWFGLAGAEDPGRVFLHVERSTQTVDLAWELVDAEWLDVLELEGDAARIEARADALADAPVGASRRIRLADGVVTLEVRPR